MNDQNFCIFIISLKNSDRTKSLVSDLNTKNLNFSIIDAVEGNKLTQNEIRTQYDILGTTARLGYGISSNMMACALSHLKTYNYFSETSYDWALVFEEDARITNYFDLKAIQNICNQNINIPTIIQLFSRSSRLTKRSSWKKITNNVHMFDFLPKLTGSGTPAYLINRKAAQIAIKNPRIVGPADWPSWHLKVSFKGVYPWFAYETDYGSTIDVPKIKKLQVWSRWIQILLGIHYVRNHKHYSNFNSYISEEILPVLNHVKWRLFGSKYFGDKDGPQII